MENKIDKSCHTCRFHNRDGVCDILKHGGICEGDLSAWQLKEKSVCIKDYYANGDIIRVLFLNEPEVENALKSVLGNSWWLAPYKNNMK